MILRKLTLFVLLLFVFIKPVFSQVEYFNKISSQYLVSAAYGIIEKDSNYYIAGVFYDTVPSYQQQLYIEKHPMYGGKIITKSYGVPGEVYTIGFTTPMINTSDDGFAIIGGIMDSTGFWHAYLMKLDSNCDTAWLKYFYDTISPYTSDYLAFENIKETYDKGFIIVGEIYASHQYDSDVFLIKTDSLGNTKWYKTYGYIATVDRAFSVIQTPDSGYVIGGDSRHAGVDYAQDAYLIKTDKNGNVIWEKFLGGQYSDQLAYVALAYDSNYIVGYSYAYEENPPVIAKREISVLKITPSKQILWEKNYRIHRENLVRNILELDDHSIIIVGISNVVDTIGNNGGRKAFIMKLTENGDSLWHRDYSYLPQIPKGLNFLYDIKPTSDGGFIACGNYMNYYTPTNQSAWLVKTDSLGCDTPGCVIVGMKDHQPIWAVQEVNIFPNPASENISIEINQVFNDHLFFELFDSYGRIIKQYKISSSSIRVSLASIRNGMYFYRVRSKGQVLGKGKLIVIR